MQPQQPYAAGPIAPPPRRRTATVVVSLIVGVVLGAGGVGLGRLLSGDSDGSAGEFGPTGDARAACRTLDGFDESKVVADAAAGDIARSRFEAAGSLSASAAAGDAKYKPLAQAIRNARDRQAAAFKFDTKAKQDLNKARQICESL